MNKLETYNVFIVFEVNYCTLMTTGNQRLLPEGSRVCRTCMDLTFNEEISVFLQRAAKFET